MSGCTGTLIPKGIHFPGGYHVPTVYTPNAFPIPVSFGGVTLH